MAEVVIYKPADILRWLKLGSEGLRKDSKLPVIAGEHNAQTIKKAVGSIVGKALDFGKGAVAAAGGWAIDKLEYRMDASRIEIAGTGLPKAVQYADVQAVRAVKRSFQVDAGSASFTIKPYAWLVVSGIKVPLGWERNGMEVPFRLLAEELAARAKVKLT